MEAFVLGENYIAVECDGYASMDLAKSAGETGYLDWGDVRLVRPQTLTLNLVGLEHIQGYSPDDLLAYSLEGPLLPRRYFSSSGSLTYEGVPPGDYHIIIEFPDQSITILRPRLDPGKNWTLDFKIAGDRRLMVRVVDGEHQPLPYEVQVFAAAHEENGVLVLRQQAPVDGVFIHEGIRASSVEVLVHDLGGQNLATRNVRLPPEGPLEIEIQVGDAPFRVLVVDEDGKPIPGAHIAIRALNGTDIHAVDDTDGQGWAQVYGVPENQVLLDVTHGVYGSSLGVRIDGSEREQEFVLVAKSSLELALRDGTEPLAGVLARMETTGGVTLGDARQTDEAGAVRFEPLGEGSYRVACHRADCWPASAETEVGLLEHARIEVQMRRLANLEFALRSAEGLPVSKTPIELRSLEFDESVTTWLEAGRIRAPGGLATDARGELRIEGLPRGTYVWSAEIGGEGAGGEFELRQGPGNQVSATLPP
jgi:hypothetical protein